MCTFMFVVTLLVSTAEDILILNRLTNRRGRGLGSDTNNSLWSGTGSTARDSTVSSGGESSWISPGMDLRMSGGGVNYLALLQQLNNSEPIPGKEFEKDLALFYVESSNGQFPYEGMNIDFTASPATLYGMHVRESTQGIFLRERWGDSHPSGGTINVRNINRNLVEQLLPNWKSHIGSGQAVWIDNGPDGYPDGPFQFEHARSGSRIGRWLDSPLSTWDVFSIIDQANGVHDIAHSINNIMGSTFSDKATIGFYTGALHNRGSLWQFIAGFPYMTNRGTQASQVGSSITSQALGVNFGAIPGLESRLYEMLVNDIRTPLVKFGVRIEGYEGINRAHAFATLALLKSDWYICPQKGSNSMALSRLDSAATVWFNAYGTGRENPIVAVFPDENFSSAAEFMAWVRTERASKPFDILVREKYPNLTTTQIDKIYGSRSGSFTNGSAYGVSNRYNTATHFMFRIHDEVAPKGMYVQAEGLTVPIVQSIDIVAAGQSASTGMFAEPAFIQYLIDLGMNPVMNDVTIDPSNPATFHQGLPEGSFNSQLGNERSIVTGMLGKLGYISNEVSAFQIEALAAMLRWSGQPYVQAPASQMLTKEGFNAGIFKRFTSGNPINQSYAGFAYTWNSGWVNLKGLDCMTHAKIGQYLGQFENNPGILEGGTSANRGYTGAPRTLTYGDIKLDATMIQLDKSGTPLIGGTSTDTAQQQNMSAWSKVIQPGDILIRQGHSETFFGNNKTSSTITLSAEEARSGSKTSSAQPREIPAGAPAWISTGDPNGLGGIRTWNDPNRHDYAAFRPMYRISTS